MSFENSSKDKPFDDESLSFKDRILTEIQQAKNDDHACVTIQLDDVKFKKPAETPIESDIEVKINLQKQFAQAHKERIEKFFIEPFFCLIHTFTNVAQKAPRPLKMLHKVVANPYHLRTLFEMLMVISPSN